MGKFCTTEEKCGKIGKLYVFINQMDFIGGVVEYDTNQRGMRRRIVLGGSF